MPTPAPGPTGPPEELVTPGVPGFLALFFLAVAVIWLGTSMARRVRRVNYRGQLAERERAEAEERARAEAGRAAAEERAEDDLFAGLRGQVGA